MKRLLLMVTLVMVSGAASNTSADLVLYEGGLVYDTDLDITWLQDADYAQTSGYDTDG